MMADDASENRPCHTKDLSPLLLRPGQIQGHAKSNQTLGSGSLCVQHASASLWEPFWPFGPYCALCCWADSLCGEVVMQEDSGEGMNMDNTKRMVTMEKGGGTEEVECCPCWPWDGQQKLQQEGLQSHNILPSVPDQNHFLTCLIFTHSAKKKQGFLSLTWNCALAIMHWNSYRLSWVLPLKWWKPGTFLWPWWIMATIVQIFCLKWVEV